MSLIALKNRLSEPGPGQNLDGLRILHVLDHSLPLHSGYSFRSIALFREQRRLGWKTFHLTTPKHTAPGPDLEEVDGFGFYRTPPLPPAGRLPGLAELALIRAVARRIEQIVDVEKVDILHAHSPVLNALACLIAARRLRLPVVYEVRGFWEDAAVSHGTATEGGARYRVSRALETYALKRSDAVTTICEGLRSDMLGRNIAGDKITVIPNGVDVTEFEYCKAPAPELRASLELQGKTVLGFLGSFYSYEGLDLLISALPAVLKEAPDVALLLVGGGPAELELREQARRLGLERHIRFVGRVPHGRVQDYYALVDVFVYPRHSMRLTEIVTPLKPLEAMARGGIVLVSDVGGHRELVRDFETGRFFRADDVQSLSRAVLELIANRADAHSMRAKARRFVEAERGWARSAAGYRQAYARALGFKSKAELATPPAAGS
jgi:PEP-CTERM/exosortase A-associated glycosyltransferase